MKKDIVIVIPCKGISQEERDKIENVFRKRAGINHLSVFMIDDVNSVGWVKLQNEYASKLDWDWYMYCAQDYFPGNNFLKIALDSAKKTRKKLIGLNDGKWFGRNATVALVHKDIFKYLPYHTLFFPEYFRHCAEVELTMIAKRLKLYHYESKSICVEVDYHKDLKNVQVHPKDMELFKKRKGLGFGVLPKD